MTSLDRESRVVLRQAGDGGAVDQRRQAGGEDDAVELLPIPVHLGGTVAEPHRIQHGEPMAVARAAQENR